jgi:ferredoxin
MEIHVDRARCTGIGMCESVTADYFEVLDDGTLALHRVDVPGHDLALVEDAVRACPAAALSLKSGHEV